MKIFSRPPARVQITIDSIANQIVKEWPKSELDFIKSGEPDFGLVGRCIRNDFGLWEFDHPLTQHWHMHPEAREIVSGLDCSEDHPDNVSAAILERVKELL